MLQGVHPELIGPSMVTFFEAVGTKVDAFDVIFCNFVEGCRIQGFGELVLDVICYFIVGVLPKNPLIVVFVRLKINDKGIPKLTFQLIVNRPSLKDKGNHRRNFQVKIRD